MTTNEPTGRPPTEREGPGRNVSGRPPTMREGAVSDGVTRPPTGSEPTTGDTTSKSGALALVPDWLWARFRFIRSAGSGGESNLFVVEDPQNQDIQALLKLYNTSVVLNEGALEKIRELARRHPDHVVRLIDWGVTPETNQWYEVQEYLHAGDLWNLVATHGEEHKGLRRLAPGSGLLKDVVAELHRAVAVFHGAGLSHHDIKPGNILVRAVEPTLDLVLGDFGLSIASDRTVLLSRRMGTCAYDSPESLGAGQGGPKRDFWAMGMTIAELAGGRHPFSHPSNPADLLTDGAIRDHLYHRRPIDLSAIDDIRVRRLCEGLTRYDEANRWGAVQIEAWLDGADPEVVADRAPAQTVVRGVEFAGAVRTTRADLAAALTDDWRAAVGVLGTKDRRKAFLDTVSAAFGSAGLDEREREWAEHPPGVDRVVIDVITTLDPTGAPPVVKGWSVAQTDLAPLARSAASGDRSAKDVFGPLYDQHCLIAVARLPGHGSLRQLDDQWHKAMAELEQRLAEAERHDVGATIDQAALRSDMLGALTDPAFAQALVTERDEVIRHNQPALRVGWFQRLVVDGGDDLPAVNLPAVLAARAVAQATAAAIRAEDALAREAQQERQRQQQIERRARVNPLLRRLGVEDVTVPAEGDTAPFHGLRALAIWVGVLGVGVAIVHIVFAAWMRDSGAEGGFFPFAWANFWLNSAGLPIVVPLTVVGAIGAMTTIAGNTNSLNEGTRGQFIGVLTSMGAIAVATLPLALAVVVLLVLIAVVVGIVVGIGSVILDEC